MNGAPCPCDYKPPMIRWFYLFCGMVIFLVLGIIYAWSLFAAPFEERYGWSRVDTSLVFTLTLAFYGVGNIAGGFLIARRSLRWNASISAALLCAGFFASSHVESLWQLYCSYGVVCGLGVGFSYSATISYLGRWFPDRLGAAAGILLVGYGMSTLMVGTPLLTAIQNLGLHNTLRLMAVALPGLLVLSAWCIKAPPPELGRMASGRKSGNSGKAGAPVKDMTCMEMLRQTSYHRFMIWQILAVTAGFAVIGHAATAAASIGAGVTTAALAASVLAFGNGLSRIFWGFALDYLDGLARVRLIVCATQIIAFIICCSALYLSNISLLLLGFALSGIGFAGNIPFVPVFVLQMYGEKHFSTNYSIYYISTIIASVIGPSVTAAVYFQYNMYLPAFIILCVFCCVGALVGGTIRTP